MGHDVRGAVILAGGDVHLQEGTFVNSTVLARGKVHRAKRSEFKNCRVESDVKDATAPFKFFELADVGLRVAPPADEDAKGLTAEEVRPDAPFGKAGLAKGDRIVSIDGAPVSSADEFRRQVRKAMVAQGDCLLAVSRGGKALELAVYFPTPKP